MMLIAQLAENSLIPYKLQYLISTKGLTTTFSLLISFLSISCFDLMHPEVKWTVMGCLKPVS